LLDLATAAAPGPIGPSGSEGAPDWIKAPTSPNGQSIRLHTPEGVPYAAFPWIGTFTVTMEFNPPSACRSTIEVSLDIVNVLHLATQRYDSLQPASSPPHIRLRAIVSSCSTARPGNCTSSIRSTRTPSSKECRSRNRHARKERHHHRQRRHRRAWRRASSLGAGRPPHRGSRCNRLRHRRRTVAAASGQS